MRLRPATDTELPTIAALMNLAYRATGPPASWNTQSSFVAGVRTSEEALRHDLAANPQATLLVHSDPGDTQIQASVWLRPKSPTRWHLGTLTVDPHLQSAGLGGQLLAAAEQWAAERGATTIEMSVVNVRDTLIAWYNRRGYQLTGEPTPSPTATTASEPHSATTSPSSSSKSPYTPHPSSTSAQQNPAKPFHILVSSP